MRAQFEEKEYEVAAAIELAGTTDIYHSAGQVLEKIVGYDGVAAPDASHLIWQLLQIPRPSAVRLVPWLWHPGPRPAAAQLPLQPVSLILQFKRPDYLRGGRARQWPRWRRPYFRFERSLDQHRVLIRLERNLRDDAIVRYAAPAFWRVAELEAAHASRSTLRLSGFVSPALLGRHKVWTYAEPGNDGFANPAGRPRRFETLEDVLDTVQRLDLLDTREADLPVPYGGTTQDPAIDGLDGHLTRLAGAARQREPELRQQVEVWVRSVGASRIPLSPITIDRLRSFASVTSLLSRIGATWHLISPISQGSTAPPQ